MKVTNKQKVQIIEDIVVLIGFIAKLAFIAWVFWQTQNAWTFLLLLVIPYLRRANPNDQPHFR